jgi:hypothetical protein
MSLITMRETEITYCEASKTNTQTNAIDNIRVFFLKKRETERLQRNRVQFQ